MDKAKRVNPIMDGWQEKKSMLLSILYQNKYSDDKASLSVSYIIIVHIVGSNS